MRQRPRWTELPRRALLWRGLHTAWSVVQLAALEQIWVAALRRRRPPGAWVSAGLLAIEGAALVVGRGNCPVGPLQAAWGDPVPFFELLLPPRAAKAAIPALFLAALLGLAGLVLRPPVSPTCRSRTGGRRRHPGPA